jgi:hypothetical protein
LVGATAAIVALVAVLASTGPKTEAEISGNVRRFGGPCLQLEQWGLFGWDVIGQTVTVTQVTSGRWQIPVDNPACSDVEESLLLVRMPLDAEPDTYRICGLADDRGCLTVDVVPFESSGLGP